MAEYQLFITRQKTKQGPLFKEHLVLPNNEAINLEFLSLINAFWKLYNFDGLPSFAEAIKYFYSQISSELIDYLESNKSDHQVQSPVLNETKIMVDAILTAAGADHIFVGSEKMLDRSRITNKSFEPLGIANSMLGLYSEFIAVEHALNLWLSQNKGKNSPSYRYCNSWPEDIESIPVFAINFMPELIAAHALQKDDLNEAERLVYAHFRLLHAIRTFRSNMLHTDTVAMSPYRKTIRTHSGEDDSTVILCKMHCSRFYKSLKGILPLLWGEILYCIDNDLSIRQCLNCNKWFHVKKNEKYCSDSCRHTAKKNQDAQRYLSMREEKKNAQEKRE